MKTLCRGYTFTSKWRSIPSKRVDRTLVSRQNSFLGSNCEWNWRLRVPNVRRNSCWKRSERRYRETCCEGKATTTAFCDIVYHFCSCSWKKLDRHQLREISSRLFYSVKSHDQITATWTINQKMMEQYDMTMLWKSSRQRSMVLRNGQITIG